MMTKKSASTRHRRECGFGFFFRRPNGWVPVFSGMTATMLLSCATVSASAQVNPASAFTERGNQLPAVMRAEIAYDSYFTESFRSKFPEARFRQLRAKYDAALGPVTKVEGLTATSPFSGKVMLGYERATVTMWISVDRAAPHLVSGLRIVGTKTRDD